jgi:hypothetical protein
MEHAISYDSLQKVWHSWRFMMFLLCAYDAYSGEAAYLCVEREINDCGVERGG